MFRIQPHLRFPRFKEPWKKTVLGDISKRPMYGVGASAVEFNNKDVYVRITDIEDKSRKLMSRNFTSPSIVNEKYLLKDKDILFARTGASTGKTYIHENYEMKYDYYFAGFLIKFEILKSYYPDFVYQYTLTNSYENWIKVMSVRSGQPGINSEEYSKLKLNIPRYEEQKKIGEFFSKLDRQIELEEQKLEKLEEQKKGYMQKIFSQELRFKDDNGNSYPDWSIKKIEDISKVNKGFTPNTKNDEYWDELNENWLSIAGMTQKYLYKGNKGITEKGASKHVKVDKDTLIMSFKLTLGKLAIVKEPIYTNEAICHFVWKESNVNTEYMYYYLNSINISTFGAQAVKGVTLNNDSINSIIVKLPVIQEQNKIAYFFNELDKLIRKQYAKIELLKQRKNGLLQKMFV
ncbi:TPA: restriction endonuclease subunit S [Staphylococcus aureus]